MEKNQMQSTIIFGLVLIALGVFFLAGQFVNIEFGQYLWPFAVIGFGALFFVAMLLGGRSSGGLAVPGSMIVTTGLILLAQNTFNRFETWAYAWTLVMTACGIGIVIHGYWSGLEDFRRKGWDVARLGMLFFLLFGSFFELFVFSRYTQLTRILWPLALIVAGVILIAYRFITNNPQKQS